MAAFRYVAKSMEGKMRRGTMEAAGISGLQQTLREQGFCLIRAKEVRAAEKKRKLSPAKLQAFCRELSALLSSGISIVRGLEIIAEGEGLSATERTIYSAVLAELKKGASLSEAMTAQNCFPELMLGMVYAGEESGGMDVVMERLFVHYQKEYHLGQQVKSAMIYPMVLLAMCIGVVLLIVAFILPQFEELFSEMESLPAPTEFLMTASDFLIHKWFLLLCIVPAAGVFFTLAGKIRQVRRITGYLKLHLPVVGRLNRVICTARFSRTLSSLYSSGMTIVASLQTAAGTVGNCYIEEQSGKVAAMIRSGVPLSAALKEVDGFLNKLSGSVLVGEESGKLDTMLDSVASMLEEEAESATRRLVTLLEPVMICLMALLVGFIIIAVMLPIYQSYGAIEGTAL